MDLERSLISRVISDGDLDAVSNAKITREYFQDLDNQRVFDTMVRHRRDYGTTPTLSVMRVDHPDYRFVRSVEEPLAYLIDKMREERKATIISQTLAASMMALTEGRRDVDTAQKALSAGLSQIVAEVPAGSDLNLTESPRDFWAYYEELKALEGRLRGIPTGFQSLDQATLGWQPGDLIVITGVQKSGKSTVLLNSAMATNRYGKSPLFIGFEMSNRDQQERYVAFWSGISYERLRAGSLTRPEERALKAGLNSMESMPDFLLSTDAMGTQTVGALAAKLEETRPDVCFLDGVYMMDDEHGEPKMSPQALSNIVQGLKQTAMNTGIPIVCTTQSLESKLGKGGRVTSGSVGYTSAFGQYCEAMIASEQTELPNVQRVSLVLGRKCRPFEMFVEWDWDRGRFSELDGNPFEDDDHGDSETSRF